MTAVDARAVSKQFLLRHNASAELKVRFLGLLHRHHRQTVEEFWALKDVSIRINQGESVAMIGRNGSGKSTFLKLVAAIHQPTSGRLLVARGARICSMIELGAGFHHELTGRENVFLNAALHGLTGQQIEAIYDGVVSYSGLEHFIDVPIKNYSSGMYMRLGFAIAAKLEPDILLLDEIFAVGDADFQHRCVQTLKGFMEAGKTIIFVSHAPAAVRTICSRTCVLDHGELVFDGDVESGLAFYDHLLARGTANGDSDPPSLVPNETDGAAPAGLATSHASGWSLDFLRQEGLQPRNRVLHVGAPDSSNAGDWSSFLHEDNYVRLADDAALVGRVPTADAFDFALVESLFSRLPFNRVARSIATIVCQLRPSGRFYGTWFENPDPANFEPIVQPNGVTTYPDCEPYHYPLALIENVCGAVGATVERVTASHPGGESIFVVSRRA